MNHRPWSRKLLIVLALLATGCGSSTSAESPPLRGQRVQSTSVAAQGAVPYHVGMYEFTFAGGGTQARRGALLVDMAGDRGSVRGFVDWGTSGQVPVTYVAGGRAQQSDVKGELVTVFELVLNHLEARNARRRATDSERIAPFGVRVVVNEASGDVTLTERH